MTRFLIFWIALQSFTTCCYSQKPNNSVESQYSYTPTDPFFVRKSSTNDFTSNSGDRNVASFRDEVAAQNAADRLNSALKPSDPFFYQVIRNVDSKPSSDYSPDTSNVTPRSKINVTPPKFVDPGPSSALSSSNSEKLLGKDFKGTIGTIDVTYRFKPDGLVKIDTGLRSLEGKWILKGPKLVIYAPNAKFEGKIKGNVATGDWIPKDSLITRTKWQFELNDGNESVVKGNAYNAPSRPQAPIADDKPIQYRMYFVDKLGRFEHPWTTKENALEALDSWFPQNLIAHKGAKEAGVQDSNGNVIVKRVP